MPDPNSQRRPSPTTHEVLPALREGLGASNDVRFAYLFGSVAKGRVWRESDVDVAVWLDEEELDEEGRFDRALELAEELGRRIGRRVQVVTLNDAPLDLAHNVLGHGILVADRDPNARRRFVVDHVHRWVDMRPARRAFWSSTRRRIEEGTFGGGARDRP